MDKVVDDGPFSAVRVLTAVEGDGDAGRVRKHPLDVGQRVPQHLGDGEPSVACVVRCTMAVA